MSKSKYTDRICIFILVITLAVTLIFMQGEKFGIVMAESDQMSDEKGVFSDRDFAENWSEKTAILINLESMDNLTDNGAYTLDGNLYLVDKGTYVLSGKLNNQQIIVNAKGAKIQVVLNGVEITEENQPAILIEKADKVFLTLEKEMQNVITVDSIENAEVSGYPDAAIYSNGDLTINGEGSLSVTVKEGHGIKSKDDLIVTNGQLTVNAGGTALLGKDSVRIAGGTFDLTAGEDGIKANNDSNEEKGYVTIRDGSFVINAAHDGIQAETDVNVEGGTFSITTGGGAENGKIHTDEFGMGGFGGGFGGDFGGNFARGFGNDSERQNGRRELNAAPDDNAGGMQPPIDGNMPEIPGGMQAPTDGNMPEMPEGMQAPTDGSMPEMPERMQAPTDGNMPEMPEGMQAPTDGSMLEMPEGMQQSTDGNMPEMPEGIQLPSDESLLETSEDSANTEDTSDSYKGIKAGKTIKIHDGKIELNCADDAIHSDDTLEILGGEISIATGDDGIHAEQNVEIQDGVITVSKSYEGIEGKSILIAGGVIDLTAEDDGINAGGGTDTLGFGMMNFMGRGQWTDTNSEENQQVNSSDSELSLLHITGGTIHVDAAGDGLDSNGNLIIDGGFIIVDGPENSGNGALDSGTESGGDCTINGGTIIALGASGMAESFSEQSTQCSFNCIFSSNFNQGDELTISDSEGNVLYQYTIKKSGNSVVFSNNLLKLGETYTIQAGEQSQEMLLESISNGSSFSMGMRGRF